MTTSELRDARRFLVASVTGGVVALAVLAWFATRGAATLFDRPRLGGFFDAQARALFHGRWNVPAGGAAFERFDIDGKYYMYFGPTPALLRMPLLLVSDWFDGRLSRVAMIVACGVVVFGIARLSWLARRTVRGDRRVSRGELVLAVAVVVAASLGTVVPFVAAWTAVYHEAIAWGLAFALVSYGALAAWLLDQRSRDLVVAGVAAALSVLARGSVGLGPVVAIAVIAGLQLLPALRRGDDRAAVDWRVVGGLGAAVVVSLALYGYVNATKFGSPLAAPPYAEQDRLADYPPRIEALEANDGNLFGADYAPTILYHYLRPNGVELDSSFPWILTSGSTHVVGDAVFDNLRPTVSTPASAPLALLFAIGGAVVVVARRPLRRIWLATMVGAAVGCAGALSVAFVDQRYQADFVPLLVVPGVVGVWALVDALAGRARALGVATLVVCALLGVWSVWANIATAYVYQRSQVLSATIDDRASLVTAQLRVQDLLGLGVPSGTLTGGAPSRASVGQLLVLGDCAGVYRYDGAMWQPVEQSPASGYRRVRMRLDPDATGRQPVASYADGDLAVLWATRGRDGRVDFEYEWAPSEPPSSKSTRIIPMGSATVGDDGFIDLEVRVERGVFDTRLHLSADGRTLRAPVVPEARAFDFGHQSGLPGAAEFAGRIRELPVPTPVCDRLVDLGLDVRKLRQS